MSSRIVGNYRSVRARGASVPTPSRNRHEFFAVFGKLVIAGLVISLCFAIGFGAKEAFIRINSQRINLVQIDGSLTYVSRDEIQDSVNRFVDTSMVVLDLDALKNELEKKPWVHSASVRRQWPDRLVIKIEEELAVARWGEKELLNQQGKVFSPEVIGQQLELPFLSGPQGRQLEVMQQYQQFNQLLYPLGVRIRELELNVRGAWTITVTNAVQTASPVLIEVKVGKKDVLHRLRNLVTFFESEASDQIAAVRSIDLRYDNGLAVAYRSGEIIPGQHAGRVQIESLVTR